MGRQTRFRVDDLGADDESFERFSFPFSRPCDLVSEVLHVCERIVYSGRRFQETPLFSECVDDARRKGVELCTCFVYAMQIEAGLFWRIWQDMFFKVVIAELSERNVR